MFSNLALQVNKHDKSNIDDKTKVELFLSDVYSSIGKKISVKLVDSNIQNLINSKDELKNKKIYDLIKLYIDNLINTYETVFVSSTSSLPDIKHCFSLMAFLYDDVHCLTVKYPPIKYNSNLTKNKPEQEEDENDVILRDCINIKDTLKLKNFKKSFEKKDILTLQAALSYFNCNENKKVNVVLQKVFNPNNIKTKVYKLYYLLIHNKYKEVYISLTQLLEQFCHIELYVNPVHPILETLIEPLKKNGRNISKDYATYIKNNQYLLFLEKLYDLDINIESIFNLLKLKSSVFLNCTEKESRVCLLYQTNTLPLVYVNRLLNNDTTTLENIYLLKKYWSIRNDIKYNRSTHGMNYDEIVKLLTIINGSDDFIETFERDLQSIKKELKL